jgi:hypothetical protein
VAQNVFIILEKFMIESIIGWAPLALWATGALMVGYACSRRSADSMKTWLILGSAVFAAGVIGRLVKDIIKMPSPSELAQGMQQLLLIFEVFAGMCVITVFGFLGGCYYGKQKEKSNARIEIHHGKRL